MKKEIIIAIIIGFLIGLVITFGIYQAQKSYVDDVISPDPTPTTIPVATPDSNAHTLDLVNPEDFTINESGTVVATGFTTPLSYVTVTSVEAETATQANVSGSFTIEIDLTETVNLLVFTSVAPDGTRATIERTVSYINQEEPVTEEENSEDTTEEEQE